MQNIFEKSDGGITVRINQRGDEITFIPNYPIVIENIMDSSVLLTTEDDLLRLEATTPESPTPHSWTFELSDLSSGSAGQLSREVDCLEQLIANYRVALNGRL